MVEVGAEFLAGVGGTVLLMLLFLMVVVLWDIALALRDVAEKIDYLEDDVDSDLSTINGTLTRIYDRMDGGGGAPTRRSAGDGTPPAQSGGGAPGMRGVGDRSPPAVGAPTRESATGAVGQVAVGHGHPDAGGGATAASGASQAAVGGSMGQSEIDDAEDGSAGALGAGDESNGDADVADAAAGPPLSDSDGEESSDDTDEAAGDDADGEDVDDEPEDGDESTAFAETDVDESDRDDSDGDYPDEDGGAVSDDGADGSESDAADAAEMDGEEDLEKSDEAGATADGQSEDSLFDDSSDGDAETDDALADPEGTGATGVAGATDDAAGAEDADDAGEDGSAGGLDAAAVFDDVDADAVGDDLEVPGTGEDDDWEPVDLERSEDGDGFGMEDYGIGRPAEEGNEDRTGEPIDDDESTTGGPGSGSGRGLRSELLDAAEEPGAGAGSTVTDVASISLEDLRGESDADDDTEAGEEDADAVEEAVDAVEEADEGLSATEILDAAGSDENERPAGERDANAAAGADAGDLEDDEEGGDIADLVNRELDTLTEEVGGTSMTPDVSESSLEAAVEELDGGSYTFPLSGSEFEVQADADGETATLRFTPEDGIELDGARERLLKYQLRNYLDQDETAHAELSTAGGTVILEIPGANGPAVDTWADAAVQIVDRTLYLSKDEE